jgi:hypothetical protein
LLQIFHVVEFTCAKPYPPAVDVSVTTHQHTLKIEQNCTSARLFESNARLKGDFPLSSTRLLAMSSPLVRKQSIDLASGKH